MMTTQGILYQDYAKLEYGRILWRRTRARERLLRHWMDPRHPHSERFQEWRPEVEHLLESNPEDDDRLDAELRKRGLSLRVVVREIPSVFGHFYETSRN